MLCFLRSCAVVNASPTSKLVEGRLDLLLLKMCLHNVLQSNMLDFHGQFVQHNLSYHCCLTR